MITDTSKILTIKSAQTELSKVEDFLKNIFSSYKLPFICFNKVKLCVNEAMINAIVHGNKSNVNKEVSLIINYERKRLKVTVIDQGNGFDVGDVPDPTCEENIKKESGRGVYIIKSLAKDLHYDRKENSLQFQITINE